MYKNLETWINNILVQDIPANVVAFCFNLYEDIDNTWSMELVGTESFDEEDSDWACDEVTDFGTRDNPIAWHKEATWEEILEEVIGVLKVYLDSGIYANILKDSAGIGVGFVDGDIEILYAKYILGAQKLRRNTEL